MPPGPDSGSGGAREHRPKARYAGVDLRGVHLRKVHYDELGKVATDAVGSSAVTFSMSGRVIAQDRNTVALHVDFDLKPVGLTTGIQIAISLSALFARMPEIDALAFISFVNRQGGPLLFPFIRELTANLTQRGLYEPIWLDPVSLDPLLAEDQVIAIAAGLDALGEPDVSTVGHEG